MVNEMITALAVRIQMRLRDRGDTGATAVEYALIIAVVVVAVGVTIGALGTQIQQAFNDAVAQFTNNDQTP